jgi:hypothetical protein
MTLIKQFSKKLYVRIRRAFYRKSKGKRSSITSLNSFLGLNVATLEADSIVYLLA